MADRTESNHTSQAAVAEINRSIKGVNAEISADLTKSNRRVVSAKAAALSEAADIARAAGEQLTAARARILDQIARAEAAGFIVQQDFSVRDSGSDSTRAKDARDHAAAIRAVVADFAALDGQVWSRLTSAGKDLRDLSDN